jgi:HD-GYP domain-containing protein (c-di-GMP phosphodiesterase class II)
MSENINPNSTLEGIIEVRLLKPGSRFALNVYDEDNNLILEAHVPISEGVINHLKASGILKLYYDPSALKSSAGEAAPKAILSDELIRETYDHTKNILDEIRETFRLSPEAGVSRGMIDSSRTLVDKIIKQTEKNDEGVFETFTKLKDMDEYYYHHSTNVAILASILGSRLDFKPDMKSAMGVGGLFHDIGFSSISQDILKKAQLSDDEFDIVKGHTHVGYKFVEKNPHMHDIEKRILLLHHERADGEGYPYGFDFDHYQDSVPREIRLASLIDVFVSITLPRPGEKPLSAREAIRTMVNMVHAPYKTSCRFLPNDMRDFLRALGFIVNRGDFFMKKGDLVRVSSGEIGIIEEMNKLYPLNPRVTIIKNSRMENLKRPVVVDLLKTYQNMVTNIYDRNAAAKPAGSQSSPENRT